MYTTNTIIQILQVQLREDLVINTAASGSIRPHHMRTGVDDITHIGSG